MLPIRNRAISSPFSSVTSPGTKEVMTTSGDDGTTPDHAVAMLPTIVAPTKISAKREP